MNAGWGRVDHLLNALEAELIACLHGVQAACNLGIGNLILETDATLAKQALTTDDLAKSMSGGLIDELKSLVSSNFINFECLGQEFVIGQLMSLPLSVWVASKGRSTLRALSRITFM